LTRLRVAGLRLTGPRLAAPRLAGPKLAGPRLAGLRLAGLRLAGLRPAAAHLGRSHGRPGGRGRPGRTSRHARSRLALLGQAELAQDRLSPAGPDLARRRQTGRRQAGRQQAARPETRLREGRPLGQPSPLPAALLPPCHAEKSAAVMLGRALQSRRAQVIRA
jgi:hypothetical protein